MWQQSTIFSHLLMSDGISPCLKTPACHIVSTVICRCQPAEVHSRVHLPDQAHADRRPSPHAWHAVQVAGVGKASLAAAGQHAHFDPDTSATWEPGKPVPFSFLSSTFAEIEGTTKRIEIANFLTRALRTIIATTPEDLLPTVYLLAGRVAPSHAGVELGIGDAMLIKVIMSSMHGYVQGRSFCLPVHSRRWQPAHALLCICQSTVYNSAAASYDMLVHT